MKTLLAVTAGIEAATGGAIVIAPATVVRLLFAAELTGAGVVVSRLAGISLIALGIACWPGGGNRAAWGMLTYNLLVAAYLLCLGLGGEWTGVLLWPGVALHAVASIFLAAALWKRKSPGGQRNGAEG